MPNCHEGVQNTTRRSVVCGRAPLAWRHVHSCIRLRSRTVPVDRNSVGNRDVLWRLSVSAVNRHHFWYNLRRSVKLRKFCKLHMAHRFQWSLVLVIQYDQSLILVIHYGSEL